MDSVPPTHSDDVFGFVHPGIDAHTLGIGSVSQLLAACGFTVVLADRTVCDLLNTPSEPAQFARFRQWLERHRITRLGFSYRLDPDRAVELFGRLIHQLMRSKLLASGGGQLSSIYFAGLPSACERIQRQHEGLVTVFLGDEVPGETLAKLGIPRIRWPSSVTTGSQYDEHRLRFARELIASEKHLAVKPLDRSGYPTFGTCRDSMPQRVQHARGCGQPPLLRAHVGPSGPDRIETIRQFLGWARELAQDGFLDVLSIGTSQLSQSMFGEDWQGRLDGGGVPINSPEEYRAVWEASRPMLVRTYAGTKNIPQMAALYEDTIHMAWHALSFWWFCQLDGRGNYTLIENLQQHVDTLRVIAAAGKPFEPNVSHHFAFRGGDDITYIASAVVAAQMAKRAGVRYLVVQNMLNTPKSTWGIQDLAKARAMLQLVRELETPDFMIYYQPRAGLDYFSHDLEKARIQLAAVTALMADVEPLVPHSPDIIHVVSFSEGAYLATPPVVRESLQITLAAFDGYRRFHQKGLCGDMALHSGVVERQAVLMRNVRHMLRAMQTAIPDLYTPKGLYSAFQAGFFAVPYLWMCRDEFANATAWRTQEIDGGVSVVDDNGRPIPVEIRAEIASENAKYGCPIAT